MKLLEKKIEEEGSIIGNDIVRVDRFLTHQVDPTLMRKIGETFANAFAHRGITKVVTIEASGIAPAIYTAELLGVPMVFAKKSQNITLPDRLWTSEVFSFTKKVTTAISVSKDYMTEKDHILLIDDFLANGHAAKGLLDLAAQSGATVEALGIVIEKSFQGGRQLVEALNCPVYSLARIQSSHHGKIEFAKADL